MFKITKSNSKIYLVLTKKNTILNFHLKNKYYLHKIMDFKLKENIVWMSQNIQRFFKKKPDKQMHLYNNGIPPWHELHTKSTLANEYAYLKDWKKYKGCAFFRFFWFMEDIINSP